MNEINSIVVVALAAFIHASFQLSISVLTLLSSHTIGAKRSSAKLAKMTFSFIAGAGIMTVLLLSFMAYLLLNLFGSNIPPIAWATAIGLLFGVAIAIWLFYYRREKGTMLWIPRNFAIFLSERTKRTHMNTEAFGLGLSSVIGEILFIIAPLTISAMLLINLHSSTQLIGIFIYTLISLLPLATIGFMINKGFTISKIQKWREANKYFLQFAAGAGLIALGLFVYVSEVMGKTAGGLW